MMFKITIQAFIRSFFKEFVEYREDRYRSVIIFVLSRTEKGVTLVSLSLFGKVPHKKESFNKDERRETT